MSIRVAEFPFECVQFLHRMTFFYLNQKFTNTVLPTQLQMDIGKMASAKYQNLATLATYSFTHAMGFILYEQTLLKFSSKVGEIEFFSGKNAIHNNTTFRRIQEIYATLSNLVLVHDCIMTLDHIILLLFQKEPKQLDCTIFNFY